MIQLRLYTTLGCHLCAQLEELLHALANDRVVLERIDIGDDDALVERYGVRIPVLVDADGNELDQGMEPERLGEWLRRRHWLDEAALARLGEAPTPPTATAARQHNGRRYLG